LTGLKILGTGSCVPNHSVTNQMLETVVDTSDDWISSRTGIRSRCIANGDTNLTMAKAAAERAIEAAGIKNSDIEVVLCATITNEYVTPSLSCLLQRELGLNEEVLAFDINAACSGFVYALNTAHSLLQKTSNKYALVVGSEVLSKIMDFTDRNTCVLFGDGSGAVVVKLSRRMPFLFNSGARGDNLVLNCPAIYESNNPFSQNTNEKKAGFLQMDGSEVFRFAVESIKKSIMALLEKAQVSPEEIDHYVLHQANSRIICTAAKRLGAPIERFFMNIEKRGNTSAASIPIALDEMRTSGRLKRGDKLVLSGFGGGLTYGSVYMAW
jgi:3-oxoacyl-[acyl-carrier-protein] synthase-3